MLDKTSSLASTGYHPGARTGRLCIAGAAVPGMRSLWGRAYMRKRERARERGGREERGERGKREEREGG